MLLQHDLDDLIEPIITIDLYKPKFNMDNIVVGLELKNPDAGLELRFFIDRGDFDCLDSEISIYPNRDGNYNLLLEFERNRLFPENLLKLIHYINKLTNISEWKFIPYIYNTEEKLNKENLEKFIRLKKNLDKDSEIEAKLNNFFKNYITLIDGSKVSIKTSLGILSLKLLGETSEDLLEQMVYENNYDLLQLEEKSKNIFISDNYHIVYLKDYIAIKNNIIKKIFLFKPILQSK